MKKTIFAGCFALVAGLVMATTTGAAFVDGVVFNERVFNDIPDSVVTTAANFPGLVEIGDAFPNGGTGVNRHDALLSNDGGLTAKLFAIGDPFDVRAEVTLTDGSDTPRKEAGIRINSPITGDVLFIVNSDAGEIVAFGGGGPFHIFGKNDTGNGYSPGDTILMGTIYRPGAPGTLEYVIDRGSGLESSGPLPFANLEGGPVNFRVGLYGQGGPNAAGDFFNVHFANISARVPEPSSILLAVLAAIGGLWMVNRRAG